MLILFDVDNVLVAARGYRAALQKTVAYFSRRLGLGEITLTETDIEVFESQSITTEWDSGAISVAALLLARHGAAAPEPAPADLWDYLETTSARLIPVARPDFSALALRVGQAMRATGQTPGAAALALFLAEDHTAPLQPLFSQLLADCYNLAYAPVAQITQMHVLGQAQYTQAYGQPARLDSEPLLATLDQPILLPQWRDRLLAGRARGEIFPVLYTARPSLAPIEISEPGRGYTPEAEMARALVGLVDVPVMGSGKLDWLARSQGQPNGELAGFIKPGRVHVWAALAAAGMSSEKEALEAALAFARQNEVRPALAAWAGQTVHVFEDSPASLRGVAAAVESLNARGLRLHLVRHGIAAAASPKYAPLAETAERVHADVNAGLREILPPAA